MNIFKNKKLRIYFIMTLVSATVMLTVFNATDGLLGDKEFSAYTDEDWAIAAFPLAVIVLFTVLTLVFAVLFLVAMMRIYPALTEYVTRKKFFDIDEGSKFLVFDHDELKRACCRPDDRNGVWFSVKQYDLQTKRWITLETGRHLDKMTDLAGVLQRDYQYDKTKVYTI